MWGANSREIIAVNENDGVGLQDLGEGGNMQGAREAVEEQVMDNESQDLNLAGDMALAPTSSGECSATSGKGKRAMDQGVVMLRRSARGMGHPMAGSIFVPAILNTLSSDQLHDITSKSGFVLNDDVISDIKNKENERANGSS